MRYKPLDNADICTKRRKSAFPEVALWFAAFAAGIILLKELFWFPLYARLWILFSPYAERVVGLVFIAAMILALIALFFVRRQGVRAAYSAVLCALTVLIATFVPLSDLYLWANFHWYQRAREAIVRQADAGVYRPNLKGGDDLIALGPDVSRVSGLDNSVAAERVGGKTYVMFFLYNHILDNWAGFLYVPPGGDIKRTSYISGGREVETVQWSPHWYFVRPW